VIQTEAIVLHTMEYRETSRIVRLATRDLGVVSAIARGAKRPKSKFGQGLDLFTSGVAHLIVSPAKDLHTLTGFDATQARPALAASLQRFGAAAALSELCLRFGMEAAPSVHDALGRGLDALSVADAQSAAVTALAAGWQIVSELGFAPTVDRCAVCHRELAADEETRFAHRAGGAVCDQCKGSVPGARALPAGARRTLAGWLEGHVGSVLDGATTRAHQRLLREFLEEHLMDGRALVAFVGWERGFALTTAETA
jgi:DNA repair protein RecO (recombination protein O)